MAGCSYTGNAGGAMRIETLIWAQATVAAPREAAHRAAANNGVRRRIQLPFAALEQQRESGKKPTPQTLNPG